MMKPNIKRKSIHNFLRLHPVFFVLLIGVAMWETPGQTIQVLPMEQEFDPQKNKNLEVVINNTNGDERAVEITLYARSQDKKGQEQRVPSKDFFIIPRQTKILAGQHQTIKLIWQGPSELLKEQAYRLVVEQLPIDLIASSSTVQATEKTETRSTQEKENSEESQKQEKNLQPGKLDSAEKNEKTRPSKNQIEFLYKFIASIYARPSSALPKVEFEVGVVDEKKQNLKLVVINSGLAHQLLSHGHLVLESDKNSIQKIALGELPSLYNLNLMAGSRLNIEIPWKEKHPPIKVSFEEKDH